MESRELIVTAAPHADTDVIRRDGFLGQSWFADRVWQFRLHSSRTRVPADLAMEGRDHTCFLGFLTNEQGKRRISFPRLAATIDGETRDFLLDTGATVRLTQTAWEAAFRDGQPAVRGTSFITHSLFETWRRRHPDWVVVENADEFGEAMIQVLVVHLAGCDVGPVWFTRRADANFHE